MKNKKRLLNLGAFLIFVVIYTLPYLNWKEKNKVTSEFMNIGFEMYDRLSLKNSYLGDSILKTEKIVNEFTDLHPVPENMQLNDFISGSDTASINIKEARKKLGEKVDEINKYYSKEERRSNRFMFISFIISFGVLSIMRHYIKKLVK